MFSATNAFTTFIQLRDGKSGGALFLFLGANRVQTVGALGDNNEPIGSLYIGDEYLKQSI
jgi:hypothetical protein